MTAQKFSDKAMKRPYFGFLLRQNWPALVTNGIFLLVLNVLILSLTLSDRMYYMTQHDFYGHLISLLEDYRLINVIISSFLAVLWGCTTMPYLNSKVGVNFYHSLPVTRTAHYLQEVGCKILWFAVPMGASCLLGYIATGLISGSFSALVAWMFFEIFLYSTVYFLVFYAIMVFCASFTGTGFARLLSAGMIVFMPALILWTLYLILEYGALYADYEWLSETAGKLLLPVRAMLIVTGEGETYPVWELDITVLIAVGFLALGCLIYKRRQSELSGTPVLSKIAAGVMKYSVMFVAAALFSMALEDLAGGFFGLVIGCVVGALLAMMLMNTILTKSARRMFAGLKGLAATCVTFAVLFTVFGGDLIGLDRYVPAANTVRYVDIEVYNVGHISMKLDDEAEITRITELVDAYLNGGIDQEVREKEQYRSAVEIYEKTEPYSYQTASWERDIMSQARYMMTERITYLVSFKTAFGMRFDKRYTAYLNGDQYELLTVLAESDGFVDAFFGEENTEIHKCWTNMPMLDADRVYSGSEGANKAYAQKIWKNMRESYNGIAYFNRPVLSSICIEGETWLELPYFEGIDAAVEAYKKELSSVLVVNTKTGEMKEYTDPGIMEDILSAGVLYNGSVSGWCPKDDTYVFFGFFGDKQEFNFISAWFLKDHVPALP